MRIGNPNSEHSLVGYNEFGVGLDEVGVNTSTHQVTPPRGWAHRTQLNRCFLYMACDGVGSGLVIRVQMTHEDCATRPLLTRISVENHFSYVNPRTRRMVKTGLEGRCSVRVFHIGFQKHNKVI